MVRLTLYVRSYCHLCTDMVQAVTAQRERFGFELEVIDIDEDPQLEARYGQWVPVLSAGDQELCHYFLEPQALERYFGAGKNPI